MRILVTGASGFVGGAIVRRLAVFTGNEVVAGGRSIDRTEFPPSVERAMFDVCDPETFGPVRDLSPFDAVIHAAGLAHQFRGGDRADFDAVNVVGTENVCRLAAESAAKRFIHLSSVAVYGAHGNALVNEGFECRPAGRYAESKLAAERAVLGAFGGDALLLRLATVVGPGDAGNTSRLITQIARGRFFPVGNGLNRKTFVSVSDVAETVSKLAEADVFRSGIFNVAAPTVTVGEVVGTIYSALGRRKPRHYMPASIVRPLFTLNRRTFRSGRVLGAGELFEKWLAEDAYSGELLAETFGIGPHRPVLEEIRAEAIWILENLC